MDRLLELSNTSEMKDKLKQRTQEALDLGVRLCVEVCVRVHACDSADMQCFGAPFIVAHMESGEKETFFGSDRMELLAHTIGKYSRLITRVSIMHGLK